MNRAIIILEGADYTGKTTVSRVLQNLIPNHAYIKLSQPKDLTGQDRVEALYNTFKATAQLCEAMPNNHIIIDRFTTSEKVYGPMFKGFQLSDYESFTAVERHMARLGAHHFLLVAGDDAMRLRYQAKVREFPNEKHVDPDMAIKVQDAYLRLYQSDHTGYIMDHDHLINTNNYAPVQVAYSVLNHTGIPELEGYVDRTDRLFRRYGIDPY